MHLIIPSGFSAFTSLQSRPEGLVRVQSYLMAATNRSFRYSYPETNLCRNRGVSEFGNIIVSCHEQPEVKRNFPSVLFAQMQNYLSEEVTGHHFSGHSSLLHIPGQPCEMRKAWKSKHHL